MPKKKKKQTPEKVRNRILARRFNKIVAESNKNRYAVPQGFTRRLYDFTPEETGVAVPIGAKRKDFVISQSQLVKNYEPKPHLNHTENKKARDAYYKQQREEVLERVRASVSMPIVQPGSHDPEGLSTIDLENLTSAGVEENANKERDS